ncbi:hypothetical protein Ahy_B02g060197 [Arachis hypogaea]|uniref:FAR1 domain-containing protein n=1 Tax=Arachis hypogaea TaxID=3818 RepID=A0A445AHZ1_ARAHY|nr:hypothetical protein Ahy_B02g060197 [Arachis hypogaea]
MDVDSEPLSSQDNVKDCMMTGVEENVNCICDCGVNTYNLYVSYARCVGFRVRKGDTLCGKDGTQRRRQFFCNKEGKKREHRPLTRTGCEAMLAVYFDTKTSTWRVKKLVEKHNHDLMVYGDPILTIGVEALELCAANFYTKEILGKIKMEIQGVVALDIINEKNISTIIVLKVKECKKEATYIQRTL